MLQPKLLTVRVLHQYTGEPIQGAQITDGKNEAQTDSEGMAKLQYLQDGAQIDAKLADFAPAKVAFSGQPSASSDCGRIPLRAP